METDNPLSCPILTYEIGNLISTTCGLFSIIYYYGFVTGKVEIPTDKTNSIIFTIYLIKFMLHVVQSCFHLLTNSGIRLCINNKNHKLYRTAQVAIRYLAPNQNSYEICVRICNVCIIGMIVAEIILLKSLLNIKKLSGISPIFLAEIIFIIYLCYTVCYRLYKGTEFFNIYTILNNEPWPPHHETNFCKLKKLSFSMYLYAISALVIAVLWSFILSYFLLNVLISSSIIYCLLIIKFILLVCVIFHGIIVMLFRLTDKHTMNKCAFAIFARFSKVSEYSYTLMVKWCNIGITLTLCIELLFMSSLLYTYNYDKTMTCIIIFETISFIYLFYVIAYRILNGSEYFWNSIDWILHIRGINKTNNMGIVPSTLLKATLDPVIIGGNDNWLLNDIWTIFNDSSDKIDKIYTRMAQRFNKYDNIIMEEKKSFLNPVLEYNPDEYYNNWSLTERFKPIKIVYIKTVEDIINEIKYAKKHKHKIRAVTYGHSFSPIHGDSDCIILGMIPKHLSSINPNFLNDFQIKIMANSSGIAASKIIVENYPLMFVEFLKNNVVKVGGSTPIYLYYHLCDIRIKLGLPIPSEPCNVMQLHQSFIGTTGVSSHGSGIQTSPTTDYVIGIKFVDGNGKIRDYHINKNENDIKNVSCHLGMLGVVIELELQYEPCYYCQLTPKFIEIDEIFPVKLEQGYNNISDDRDYSIEYFKDIICNTSYNQFLWFPTTDLIMILSFTKTFNKKNLVRFPAQEYLKQKQRATNKVFGVFKKFFPYLVDSQNKTMNNILTHLIGQGIANTMTDYFVVENVQNINDVREEEEEEEEEDEKIDIDSEVPLLPPSEPRIRNVLSSNYSSFYSSIIHKNIDNHNNYLMNNNSLTIPSIDAIHPFWGIQSQRVNNIEIIIPIKTIINQKTKKKEPDIELIKEIYVSGLSLYNEKVENDRWYPFNLVLEMRVIGKSKVLLSPFNYKNYEYFCAIETAACSWGKLYIDKYLQFTKELTKKWANITNKHYKNCDILIRPHWAKQWKHFDGNECVSDQNENNFDSIYDFFKNVYGENKIKLFNKYRKSHDPNNMFIHQHLQKIFGIV